MESIYQILDNYSIDKSLEDHGEDINVSKSKIREGIRKGKYFTTHSFVKNGEQRLVLGFECVLKKKTRIGKSDKKAVKLFFSSNQTAKALVKKLLKKRCVPGGECMFYGIRPTQHVVDMTSDSPHSTWEFTVGPKRSYVVTINLKSAHDCLW